MEGVSKKAQSAPDSDSSSSENEEDVSRDDKSDVSMLTWPKRAADLLLYTLTNDPSIRARRAAMRTLRAAQACSSSPSVVWSIKAFYDDLHMSGLHLPSSQACV